MLLFLFLWVVLCCGGVFGVVVCFFFFNSPPSLVFLSYLVSEGGGVTHLSFRILLGRET